MTDIYTEVDLVRNVARQYVQDPRKEYSKKIAAPLGAAFDAAWPFDGADRLIDFFYDISNLVDLIPVSPRIIEDQMWERL